MEPLLSLPHAYLYQMMTLGVMGAHLGELVTSPLSYLGAQASQRLAWASQGSEKGLK